MTAHGDLLQGMEGIGAAAQSETGSTFRLIQEEGRREWLLVEGAESSRFDGDVTDSGRLCPISIENARSLGECLPWLRPQRIPSDRPSFGFGDRLGSATPGHIRSLRGDSVFPILAQQSVRENARTGRSFADVLRDVVFAALREGYRGGFGADADHLKEIVDAEEAARLGYTFFTCDPGDLLESVADLDEATLGRRFSEIERAPELRKRYEDRTFGVGERLVLHFDAEALRRIAVKYERALGHAATMFEAIRAILGDAFDYEVSVDETLDPTSPLEHLYVALELKRRGVALASLAPRFVGAIEKGVDWRGDRGEFEQALDRHVVIARSIGTYRLSLHSGSDKYSIYPSLVGKTAGRCHIKTAGTSYLVALQAVAEHDRPLFREIVAQSLQAFANDKATYHISADPSRIPALDSIPDADLSKLIDAHDSRQLLHVAFGSIVRGPLRDDLLRVLAENEEAHFELLAQHMRRHLDAMEVEDNG